MPDVPSPLPSAQPASPPEAGTSGPRSWAAAEPFASIDAALATEIAARSLAEALRRGWIDSLAGGSVAPSALPNTAGLADSGMQLLLGQLEAAGIVTGGAELALTPGFRAVLGARDLLEARLWFLLAIAPDLHGRFALLLEDPGAFVQQAEVFRIFDYSRALTTSAADLEATARWVRYTTALTRHEAPLLVPLLGLERAASVLDVGGNSGEFALRVAATHAAATVTVVDLPAVCALGARHVAGRPAAERVRFAARDLRSEPLPGPVDAVVFKSVLHDWPEDMAARFIAKAAAALRPGGRLLIVERAPRLPLAAPMPFAMLANLVFLPFFRPAATYAKLLHGHGFDVGDIAEVMLDMPFQVIAATKRPA